MAPWHSFPFFILCCVSWSNWCVRVNCFSAIWCDGQDGSVIAIIGLFMKPSCIPMLFLLLTFVKSSVSMHWSVFISLIYAVLLLGPVTCKVWFHVGSTDLWYACSILICRPNMIIMFAFTNHSNYHSRFLWHDLISLGSVSVNELNN